VERNVDAKLMETGTISRDKKARPESSRTTAEIIKRGIEFLLSRQVIFFYYQPNAKDH
jgi:hypothetical protein